MRRLAGLLLALILFDSASARAVIWPSAVEQVAKDLASHDATIRRRAAETLRTLPESAGKRLASAALDDADVDVRLLALDASLALGVSDVGERVLPWLTDSERRLREAAAEALAESPSARAVGPLSRSLADADPAVRGAAAVALGKSHAPDAVIALLGHLDDSVPEVRRDAAHALGELADARGVVPLIGKIEDSRPIVRSAVADALGELGDPRATSALLLKLRDPDETVRVAVLRALGRIRDPHGVATIAALLVDDPSPRVRSAVLEALAKIQSPEALHALRVELAFDEPGREREPVVDVLGSTGSRAVPELSGCLLAESNPSHADGCALALAATLDPNGESAIVDALRRGSIHALAALSALATLANRAALPSVLEYLTDSDVVVRRAALDATRALLDPTHPDGRAVEPLTRALAATHGDRSSQRALLELLGRTGSPRAVSALLPFARKSDDIGLRVRALDALGSLGEANQAEPLLAALDDESASVRMAAALALNRSGVGRASAVLDRVQRAPLEARSVLALAVGGILARASDPAAAARVDALIAESRDGERDAWIEALGRMPGLEAVERLGKRLGQARAGADRAKFAEALAAHPEARAIWTALLSDPERRVRANAVWAVGEVGTAEDLPLLRARLGDSAPMVVANAAQALARVAKRHAVPVVNDICPLLKDARSLARMAALRALRHVGARCADGQELSLLAHDRSDLVREAAAMLLRDVPRAGGADTLALERAAETDRSGAVAAACTSRMAPPAGSQPAMVMVVPASEEVPKPSQPFALLRADGLVRFGLTDRRGELFELAAPGGELSLIEPGALDR
ncbi:MAG TPA: HEAT repeat domain-containing protein [Polyangiaceae bacterium]